MAGPSVVLPPDVAAGVTPVGSRHCVARGEPKEIGGARGGALI